MNKRSLSILLQLCICLLFSLETFAQPAVTSFSPSTGQVGTLVTISGTNLGSANSVSIGGKSAIIVSNTSTSIVALVMPGATTGVLSVTTGAGTGSSLGNFELVARVYPETQQGNKLVGTNGIGSQQGAAVSISADGNTALVGGFTDNLIMGAAWIFTRSNGTWSQQGTKLLPSNNVGTTPRFGKAVALSADGNTAIIGGDTDNSGVGAAWIFTRSGSTWTQQQKLTANDNSGVSLQGASVALSADGNTAMVGGNSDNSGIGAGWIFTRSNGVWSQQGSKLVGTGSVGTPGQGAAAALSADGNTVLLGGPSDDNGIGAIWVFVRNSGIWTSQ
ncbi:MAG: IPT/TIG domain-containing protein, partial [Daejeonella sp.]|nr:IPT/TIG domain-containing protein [Daejeonella sp.]